MADERTLEQRAVGLLCSIAGAGDADLLRKVARLAACGLAELGEDGEHFHGCPVRYEDSTDSLRVILPGGSTAGVYVIIYELPDGGCVLVPILAKTGAPAGRAVQLPAERAPKPGITRDELSRWAVQSCEFGIASEQ